MKFTCFLILFLWAGWLQAAVITVSPKNSIQQSIQQCQNGDTIQVLQGQYQEKQIIINKSIYLLGVNYPVLDGQLKYEVITIQADHVTIRGFKIINSGRSAL